MPDRCTITCLAAAAALSACATGRVCSSQACAADAAIDARFDALLREHPALEAPNTVRAHTTNGIVYLYGQVNSDVEKSEAEELARSIGGVRGIVDSIHFPYAGR